MEAGCGGTFANSVANARPEPVSRYKCRGGRPAGASVSQAVSSRPRSAPSESVDVAVRFTDYPGRYLLHCHNLEHEDMAMMAALRTT